MTLPATRIILDEHAAVAAMLQSLLAMLRQGPGFNLEHAVPH